MQHHPNTVMNFVMKFAEIIDEVGKRLHVGCVMAAGQDWVEVSLPQHTTLGTNVQVRFLPSSVAHDVQPGWRSNDRIGFTYTAGGPRKNSLLDFRACSTRAPLPSRPSAEEVGSLRPSFCTTRNGVISKCEKAALGRPF